MLTYRVTCLRSGTSHNFGSPEAARQLGGGINDKFGWNVDLSNYEIEVILYIVDNFVYAVIALTREPLFKRNIVHFGPTNLRATTCFNMIMLANIKPGDIVVDPMCGGGTIPIEGSFTHRNFFLGGDNHNMAVSRSRENICHNIQNNKSLCIDVVQWDVSKLPLRDYSVDVVVTDMPFGKRLGSKHNNRVLYYKSLLELARVTKETSGRAVILTHDRSSIIKSINRLGILWKNFATKTVNIGGLTAGIFVLQRTGCLYYNYLKK